MGDPYRQKRFISHGGDVWGFSRKYSIPVENVLDFSGPVNFLGPSPKAVKAIKEYARLVKYYPDPNPLELKREIAKYLGQDVEVANIILGNGSIELIYMIAQASFRGFKAVIPVPSFTEYEKAALRGGGKPIFVNLASDFGLDIVSVKRAVTADTRIVYLCNPHSPSGTLYSRAEIVDLVDFCSDKNIIVSIDENYIEFTNKDQCFTMVGYVKNYENLFVIRSVTKFYGMPGIRFGYGIGGEKLLEVLQSVRQPWSINGLAGYAVLAALKDVEFINITKLTIAKERTLFSKMLSEIGGLKVFPSETNFLLVKILNPSYTSTMLKEHMAKRSILIRDCSTFVGLDDSYFRVTVRSAEDNLKLIETLKKILKKAH